MIPIFSSASPRPNCVMPAPPWDSRLIRNTVCLPTIGGVREYVVELVRSCYDDFGPTLAAEVLLEKDGVNGSRETLRKWMIEDGLWLSRRRRRSFHQPRLRRTGPDRRQ